MIQKELILTFFILEPRLLCSHCPFYEKEGKVLKCWALRRMPKLWNYNPSPITKVKRITMHSLGAFIDLFPLVGIVWGLYEFFTDPYDHFLIGIPLIILTIIFIFMMIYYTKALLGHTCQKCPNLSCAMNKTPSNIVEAFLDKNPVMKKAWQDSGWLSE